MNKIFLKEKYSNNKMNKYKKGYTLVELSITIAILGCLTAIAIPLYRQYIEKADLTDASVIIATINLNIVQKKLTLFSGTLSKQDIETIISNNNSVSKNVKDKFNLGVSCSSDNSCSSYHLYAKPKQRKNIEKGLWLGSNDSVIYACKNSTDVATLKNATADKNCTKF